MKSTSDLVCVLNFSFASIFLFFFENENVSPSVGGLENSQHIFIISFSSFSHAFGLGIGAMWSGAVGSRVSCTGLKSSTKIEQQKMIKSFSTILFSFLVFDFHLAFSITEQCPGFSAWHGYQWQWQQSQCITEQDKYK